MAVLGQLALAHSSSWAALNAGGAWLRHSGTGNIRTKVVPCPSTLSTVTSPL
jgi:hypothetical protein